MAKVVNKRYDVGGACAQVLVALTNALRLK